MTDHYREAEERLRASDWQRQEGHLDTAMHEAAVAQVHATLALATLSVPPVRDLSEFATLTDLTDEEHARFTEAAMSARGPVPDEANARAELSSVDRAEKIPADIPAPSTKDEDLREQIRDAVEQMGGVDRVAVAQAGELYSDAAMTVVSPVLAELRAEVNGERLVTKALEMNNRSIGKYNHEIAAERDALSSLLRGMARRASEIRRGVCEPALWRVEARRLEVEWRSVRDQLAEARAELADLRSRAVVLPEDWRDQIMSLPSLVDGHLIVDELFREIESWSSPDSGKADSTATEPRGEGEEGGDRVAPGHTGREEAAGKLWDGGQPGNAGPMPADGPATPAPPSPPATPSQSNEQWCVWHGGPDPDNSAGLHLCDDEDHAREWLQWCQSDLGSGIARRTVTCSPWVVVESRPASPESTEGASDA